MYSRNFIQNIVLFCLSTEVIFFYFWIIKIKQHFKHNISDGLLDKANERLEKENIKANTRTNVFPELVNKASEQREKEDIKHNFRQAISPELLDEHSKYQEKQDVTYNNYI